MTRVVVISDTHCMHLAMPLPDGDVVIHAGDFCDMGHWPECVRFFNWFNTLPHKHRICIAGNHDVWMEKASYSDIKATVPPDVHYLNDSGIELEGIKFWGSPVQPTFFNWAFNRDRGAPIKKHWDLIPEDTDVLITHGPARGFNDSCPDFGNPGKLVHVGCEELRKRIDIVKPLVHACGHVHKGYGHTYHNNTHFFNASICNEAYHPVNKPMVFDIEGKTITPVELY